MRLRGTIGLIASACLAAGCFNVDVEAPTLNLDDVGGGSGKPPPSQLPDSGGWKRIVKDALSGVPGYMLAAEHGVLFYAYDTLAYPNQPVDLVARVQWARDLQGLEGATVGFYQGSKRLGQGRTDGDGFARIAVRPPAAGNYRFTARVETVPRNVDTNILQVGATPLLAAARAKESPIVVIDLDHTVVDAGFLRVLTIGGARPMADSVYVTKRIAARYTLVYLTHRPDLLTRKSKKWLADNGYPPGALFVSQLKDFFDSGKFKTARLEAMRKSFPNVRFGIGDKVSDAQAYVRNGLTAYLIPHYKGKPKDMRKLAREIRRIRGRGKLQVVDNWREIEAGIFEAKTFPADRYAHSLERHADRIESEEKRRKKEDDDD